MDTQTPQMAEKPSKLAEFISSQSKQLLAVGYLGLIAAVTLIFATGAAATVEVNDNTSIIHGWNHGFYVIPGLVASIASSDYSIYQTGGGALYNIGFLAGVYVAIRFTRSLLRK